MQPLTVNKNDNKNGGKSDKEIKEIVDEKTKR